MIKQLRIAAREVGEILSQIEKLQGKLVEIRENMNTLSLDKKLNKIVIKNAKDDNINENTLNMLESLDNIYVELLGDDIVVYYENDVYSALKFLSLYKRFIIPFTSDWVYQMEPMNLLTIIAGIDKLDEKIINSGDTHAIFEHVEDTLDCVI